jgi:hypothetical protein
LHYSCIILAFTDARIVLTVTYVSVEKKNLSLNSSAVAILESLTMGYNLKSDGLMVSAAIMCLASLPDDEIRQWVAVAHAARFASAVATPHTFAKTTRPPPPEIAGVIRADQMPKLVASHDRDAERAAKAAKTHRVAAKKRE